VLESNPRNLELLQDLLEKEGCRVIPAGQSARLESLLEQSPDLALVDIAGFGPEIWTHCEQLRAAGIPFVVISPRQSRNIEQASRAAGADQLLVKPLLMRELLGVVERLVAER